MKERPILFSAPMVRAILGGKKRQTRRALRDDTWLDPKLGVIRMCNVAMGVTGFQEVDCPYGQPGDRLWVREAWRTVSEADDTPPRDTSAAHRFWYEADVQNDHHAHQLGYGKLRPSIHMPRWASRITLGITEVRVERLQDISEADALAEGIVMLGDDQGFGLPAGEHFHYTDPRISYWSLWDAINGAGSVESNPLVWVVSFNGAGNLTARQGRSG